MMCQINPHHRAEYERRLELIQPALDTAKTLLRSGCKSISLEHSQFYVTGLCADWLVGRAERFNLIEIFAVAYSVRDFDFSEHQVFYTITDCYTGKLTVVLIFETNGTDHKPPIQIVFSWIDFSVLSVFVNLFDTDLIFTFDCLCDYWKCTVTNNGCLIHGEVKYPVVHDLSLIDDNTLRTFKRLQPKFRRHKEHVYYPSPHLEDLYIEEMAIKCINKYSMRLFPATTIDQYKPRDLALSFCNYIYCMFCKRREMLAIKYTQIWRHKTYAPPHGYGYKMAQTRFLSQHDNAYGNTNNNDSYAFNYCTCIKKP